MLSKKKSSEYISETSRDYGIYVNEERAIPKISDGLKSGQRIALWIMKNKDSDIKTIALAGEMISEELYLHGDVSATKSISALAGPYCNNIPFLHGEGNFGTRVGPTDFGAPRYTYVRRNDATIKLVYPDLDLVPLKDNYDGSNKEPITFLPIIPLVLLNGISGIGVGYKTSILPRKLTDIIKAVDAELQGKKIPKLEPCYEYINCQGKLAEDGRWNFSGKVEIKDSSTVIIRELPPNLDIENFKERLDRLDEADTIHSYTDNSSDQINIEVKFKRGSIANWTEAKALDFFKLNTTIKESIFVVDWSGKKIQQYESAEQIVKEFVMWRFGYYILRYKKLLAETETDINYNLGIKACFDANLPAKLNKIENKADLEANIKTITKKYQLNDQQTDRIASMPSYAWTKDRYPLLLEKIARLEETKLGYKDLLDNEDKIREIYRQEVLALGKLKRN